MKDFSVEENSNQVIEQNLKYEIKIIFKLAK